MAQQSSESADEMITGVNVTPLVDVVLVLLVILMVTASYLASHAIPVDLPKGASGEATASILSVSITRNGNVFLDAKRVDDTTFRTLVHEAREKDSEVRAVIAADGGTAHRD